MKLSGYHHRYLRIDLSMQRCCDVEIPDSVLRQFIGGSGLGTWILFSESPTFQYDPFSPEAPLVFVFSPLVGSPLTTSAKFAVVSKSPLTNCINDSLASSHFAIAGKRTGYDAIVIVGAAKKPTCLLIDSAGVRSGSVRSGSACSASVCFESAENIWGCTTQESESRLQSEWGATYRMAVIGLAGENKVRYATISHAGRHAGRGGSGAVMGSKKLKAIGVRGDKQVTFAHPEELYKYSKVLSQRSLGDATAKYRELGTVSNLMTFNRLGTLPTRNFQQGLFDEAESLAPEMISPVKDRVRNSCAACTIGCEHLFPFPGDEKKLVRMEYENLYALGPMCGISNPDIVLQASALCDEYGMDTISTGATIAFAMESAEKGLLDAPDLRFGNGEILLQTIHSIGKREGLGELLAEGSRIVATHVGGGSASFAPHVKGLELPGYDPRALQTMGLGFAVGARGADHNRSGAYQVDFSEHADRMNLTPDAVVLAIETENEATIMDSLILCKFIRGVLEDRFREMGQMLKLVTGWEISANEMTTIAERIVTAKKQFNIQQGWQLSDDTLPQRFFTEALPEGASQGAVMTEAVLQQSIQKYYQLRGWQKEGLITKARLQKLEIDNCIVPPDALKGVR